MARIRWMGWLAPAGALLGLMGLGVYASIESFYRPCNTYREDGCAINIKWPLH